MRATARGYPSNVELTDPTMKETKVTINGTTPTNILDTVVLATHIKNFLGYCPTAVQSILIITKSYRQENMFMSNNLDINIL